MENEIWYEVYISDEEGTRTLADFNSLEYAKKFIWEYNLKTGREDLFIDKWAMINNTPTKIKPMNIFYTDIDGRILSIGDLVVVLDCEDLEGDIVPKRGDVVKVSKLVDAESNYLQFSGDLFTTYEFYGHRVLKLNQ